MRASYTPGYCVDLPPGHPFPMGKFPALHDILLREGLTAAREVREPAPAPEETADLHAIAHRVARLL